MPETLVIETPRLRLRPFRENDLDNLTRFNADPQVARYLGSGKPMTRAESWRQIATFIGHQQLRGYSILAIEERSTGAFLGRSGPWFPEGWPMLEVGWGVVPERQGEGIATEAGQASLDWCFANLGVERVCSLIRSNNGPSIRVAEKLGAKLGYQLEEFLGEPADVWIHTRRR